MVLYDLSVIIQAMMRDAPEPNLQCERSIATFASQIKQHRSITVKFSKTDDKVEQKLQQLYMQKTEVKQKTLRLVVQCILDSWRANVPNCKKIDAKQRQIHDAAEATRAYYNALISKKLEPLAQGRKLISLDVVPTEQRLQTKTYHDQKANAMLP